MDATPAETNRKIRLCKCRARTCGLFAFHAVSFYIDRITCRPADLLAPEYETIKQKVIDLGYYEKEEDVLSYAVFEQVAENFFKWREAQKKGVDRDLASTGVYPV